MEPGEVRNRVAVALGLKLGVDHEKARAVGDTVLRTIQECGLLTLPVGDLAQVNAMVAATLLEKVALSSALTALLDHYLQLVNCGDCGNWDPEIEDVVIEARAALALSAETPQA